MEEEDDDEDEDTTFMDGIEDRVECFMRVLKSLENECPILCTTLGFVSLVPDFPTCTALEETVFMGNSTKCGVYYVLKSSRCMKPMTLKKHNFVPTTMVFKGGDKAEHLGKKKIIILDLSRSTVSTRVEVRKERYIISTEDFIGSIGGSLGLFLGFSFLTSAYDLIDVVFEKFV